MHHLFKIIRLSEKAEPATSINDSIVSLKLQLTTMWDMGQLTTKFDDVIEIVDLVYPTRMGVHYHSLICRDKTETRFYLGFREHKKLSKLITDLVE